MSVIFPHANNFQISDEEFVSAWSELISRYAPGRAGEPVARMNTKSGLDHFDDKRQFSLDYLCRLIVPNGYRNTMQASNIFMVANEHLLEECDAVSPVSGRTVNGARLKGDRSHAIKIPADIVALFEGDNDDDMAARNAVGVSDVAPRSVSAAHDIRKLLIEKLVEGIHRTPVTPMYRKTAVNIDDRQEYEKGWRKSLMSYFWPSPEVGYADTMARLRPFLTEAKRLASNLNWSSLDNKAAIKLANEIFRWGGVQQDPATVTFDNVKAVFAAAIGAEIPSKETPMNSGWTKLAAFASAHLEGENGRHPQVIFDSRVAASLNSRLENALLARGDAEVHPCVADIGTVVGRGGTRPREFKMKWRNGYRKWSSQLAASRFVADIRDYLNKNPETFGKMPVVADDGSMTDGQWTVRGVEMVLFMDGY